jgi:hypothetical protein
MAKSARQVSFYPTADKIDSGWHVVVSFPDALPQHVTGFASENEAKDWVKSKSKTYLKTLGYE